MHRDRYEGTLKSVGRWAEAHFGRFDAFYIWILPDDVIFTIDGSDCESDGSSTAKGVGRGKKNDLWALSKNANGRVVLPSLDSEDSKGPHGLQDKKSILRSFLTHTYRKFLPLSI